MERVDTLASTVATTASAMAKKDGEIASLRRDLQARDETLQGLVAQARADFAGSRGRLRSGRERTALAQERRRRADEGARGGRRHTARRRAQRQGARAGPAARSARHRRIDHDSGDGRSGGRAARRRPRRRARVAEGPGGAPCVGAGTTLRGAQLDAHHVALAGRGARRAHVRCCRRAGRGAAHGDRHRRRTALGAHGVARGERRVGR